MAGFVLDGSIVLAATLPDERSAQALNLLDRASDEIVTSPVIWPFEVANALLQAQRRGRITDDFRRETLDDLTRLAVAIDPGLHPLAWTTVSSLAAKHGLTVYDASYLELALRTDLPLATLDKALAVAARREHVAVL